PSRPPDPPARAPDRFAEADETRDIGAIIARAALPFAPSSTQDVKNRVGEADRTANPAPASGPPPARRDAGGTQDVGALLAGAALPFAQGGAPKNVAPPAGPATP